MSKRTCLLIVTTVLWLLFFVAGCGGAAKQAPKIEAEPEKTVETKTEPEKIVETQTEPEKTVETKTEPEKIVETKTEPEKTVETKTEPEKAVETKTEPETVAEQKPTVKLALKFEPNDVSTYKVIMEAQKSVLWEGSAASKPSAFKGGNTSNRSEMTFIQEIKSIDDKGNALAAITVKELKYLATVRDSVVIDFDSSRQKDKDNPMNGLIGQTYSLEITPAGQVTTVIGTREVQTAIKGSSTTAKTAQGLLKGAIVKQRHSIPALPTIDKNELSKGDHWSALNTFDFGMLGSKSYERIYKLEDIEESDKGKLAVVTMTAVSSSENAAELHKEQSTGSLSRLFDNTEDYTGSFKLDLEAGEVVKYREKIEAEWLAVDPESAQKPDEKPAALRMKALRLYDIERVD